MMNACLVSVLFHCSILASSLRANGSVGKVEDSVSVEMYSGNNYGWEHYWKIVDPDGEVVCSAGCVPETTNKKCYQKAAGTDCHLENKCTYTYNCQLPCGKGPYTLSCECDWGDGWNGGWITINNQKYCDSGAFQIKTVELGLQQPACSASSPAVPTGMNFGDGCAPEGYGGKQCVSPTPPPSPSPSAPSPSPSPSDPEVFGDPHVVNMAGTKFNIKQLGTFSLLTASVKSEKLFSVDAVINRVQLQNATADLCAPTFLEKISFTGEWMKDIDEAHATVDFGVRAKDWESRERALEFGINGRWHKAGKFSNGQGQNLGWQNIEVNRGSVKVIIHGMEITVALLTVSPDNRVLGKYAGFNALNLFVHGVHNVSHAVGINWTGLLAYDDFTEASQGLETCDTVRLNATTTLLASETRAMISDLRII